jgi:hypothetical protein
VGIRGFELAAKSVLFESPWRMFRALPPAKFGADDNESRKVYLVNSPITTSRSIRQAACSARMVAMRCSTSALRALAWTACMAEDQMTSRTCMTVRGCFCSG